MKMTTKYCNQFLLFILFTITVLITPSLLHSQPEHISYSALIKDGKHKPIADKQVTIRLTLLRNSASGSMLYRELHTVTTNDIGIASLLIGNGVSDIGLFKNVDWANNNVFIKVEFDTNKTSHDFIEVGTTQMLTVPYAIVAKTAENAPQYDAGNGISIKNNTITNDKPDKEISITGTNGIKIQGNYPNFIVGNENSTGGGNNLYYAGDGISIQNNTITNTLPDKILSLNGMNGIEISGNYPAYNIGLVSTAKWLNAFDSTNLLIKGAQNINYRADNTINTTGSRLLWFGDRSAFRAGWTVTTDDIINDVLTTVWDCDNIGAFSAAFGNSNLASGPASFAAGTYNKVTADNGFVAGYMNNVTNSNAASFGTKNKVEGTNSMAIGERNQLAGSNAFSTGINNMITTANSLSTGSGNVIQGTNSIAAGEINAIYKTNSIAMGYYNVVTGDASVAIGVQNRAEGNKSLVMGTASKATATNAIAIGFSAKATGTNSIAIGTAANTNEKTGAMVLADNSDINDIMATADNQMTMRFTGGYQLFTNAENGIGAMLEPNKSGWSIMSDSNKKENFITANGSDFISKILNLRLGSWNYKGDNTRNRHYGAMAQEVFEAFGSDKIGTIGNDTTINSADMDGIMLIAIQELIKQNKNQQQTIDALKEEIEMLKQAVKK